MEREDTLSTPKRATAPLATLAILIAVAAAPPASAQSIACDMKGYKPADGLTAVSDATGLQVTWVADAGQSGRLNIAVTGRRAGYPRTRATAR